MGYALKWTNHMDNDRVYYQGSHLNSPFDYVGAWNALRRELNDLPSDWIDGEDFDVEIVEIDDDFDFENPSNVWC